jgi:hypothetical protein
MVFVVRGLRRWSCVVCVCNFHVGDVNDALPPQHENYKGKIKADEKDDTMEKLKKPE